MSKPLWRVYVDAQRKQKDKRSKLILLQEGFDKYKGAYDELADLFDELNAHYNALLAKQIETKPLVKRKIPSAPAESDINKEYIEKLKAKAKETQKEIVVEEPKVIIEPLIVGKKREKPKPKPKKTAVIFKKPRGRPKKVVEVKIVKKPRGRPKKAVENVLVKLSEPVKKGKYKVYDKPIKLPELFKTFFAEIKKEEIMDKTPKQLREIFKEKTGVQLKGATSKVFKKYLKEKLD